MKKVDDEVVAVITAALAAYEENNECHLIIKSINRLPQVSPVWNTVGRIERLSKRICT